MLLAVQKLRESEEFSLFDGSPLTSKSNQWKDSSQVLLITAPSKYLTFSFPHYAN